MSCTYHHLKRKKRKSKGVRGGLVEPKVRPSLPNSFCPVLLSVGPSMSCNMFGGEISNEFAIGDFERSPPHLFLYLSLFKENKSGNKKGLYRFRTPGSLNLIE